MSARVFGAVDDLGSLTLISRQPSDGAVVVYEQPAAGGARVVTDLAEASGCPSLLETPVTWTDPQDGLTYAASSSAEGLILLVHRPDGYWSWRNLSSELSGPKISKLTTFTSRDGIVTVAGISGGELVAYQQGAETGGESWSFLNISRDQLAPAGVATPNFVGEAVSYVTEWNGLNIAGLDASGEVWSVWWAPGLSRWQVDNLSQATGAPRISGSVTAYLTSWGGINLAGTDGQGNVSVTWWVPGNPWRTSNLTTMFDGPRLAIGSLSSYVTPWGGLNIAGLNGDSLVAYWWAPGLSAWSATTLSDLITGDTPPTGLVTGITSPTGTINVVGANSAGQVVRYYWNPGDGGAWSYRNLSSEAVHDSGRPWYEAMAGSWEITVGMKELGNVPRETAYIDLTLSVNGRYSGFAIVDGEKSATVSPGTWAYGGTTFELHDFGSSFLRSGIPAYTPQFDSTGGWLLFGDVTDQIEQFLDQEQIDFIVGRYGSVENFVNQIDLHWTKV